MSVVTTRNSGNENMNRFIRVLVEADMRNIGFIMPSVDALVCLSTVLFLNLYFSISASRYGTGRMPDVCGEVMISMMGIYRLRKRESNRRSQITLFFPIPSVPRKTDFL